MRKEKAFCTKCGKDLKQGQTVIFHSDGLSHPECQNLKHPCDVCGETSTGTFKGIARHVFHYCDKICEGHLRIADDCAGDGKLTKIKEARRTAFE